MKTYFKVETSPGYLVLRASHPKAKQILWGWAGDFGSTKDPGAIQLYGDNDNDQPWCGDWTVWKWKLDKAARSSLLASLTSGLRDPARFEISRFDQRRYTELIQILSGAGK